MRALAVVLVLSIASPALAGGKVSLAYQPQPGAESTLRLQATGDGAMGMKMGGQAQDFPFVFDIAMDYHLVDLPTRQPDLVLQDATLQRLSLQMPTGPEGAAEVIVIQADGMTTNGQPQTGGTLPPGMFTDPFATVSFPRTGDPVEIATSQDLPLPNLELAEVITMFHPVLPTKKVKPGKTWTGTRELPISMKLAEPILPELTYTLTDVTGGIATIQMQGRYDASAGTKANAANGMVLVMDALTYELQGKARLDIDRGTLLSASVDLHIQFNGHTEDGTLTMKADLPTTYTLGPVPAQP